jgi:hypothetical protein
MDMRWMMITMGTAAVVTALFAMPALWPTSRPWRVRFGFGAGLAMLAGVLIVGGGTLWPVRDFSDRILWIVPLAMVVAVIALAVQCPYKRGTLAFIGGAVSVWMVLSLRSSWTPTQLWTWVIAGGVSSSVLYALSRRAASVGDGVAMSLVAGGTMLLLGMGVQSTGSVLVGGLPLPGVGVGIATAAALVWTGLRRTANGDAIEATLPPRSEIAGPIDVVRDRVDATALVLIVCSAGVIAMASGWGKTPLWLTAAAAGVWCVPAALGLALPRGWATWKRCLLMVLTAAIPAAALTAWLAMKAMKGLAGEDALPY